MYGRGYTHDFCGQAHWAGRISPYAENQMGRMSSKDGKGLEKTVWQFKQNHESLFPSATFYAFHVDRLLIESRSGQYVQFHLSAAYDKEYVCCWESLDNLLCRSQSREEVAAGTSTGDDHSHLIFDIAPQVTYLLAENRLQITNRTLKDPETFKLPSEGLNNNYLVAKEDYYFVYPTRFHEFEKHYRGSFQHGGISMEEMIIPCSVLTPKR